MKIVLVAAAIAGLTIDAPPTTIPTSGRTYAPLSGDVRTVEPALRSKNNIQFYGSFDESYNDSRWSKAWGIPWKTRTNDNKIVSQGIKGSKSMRVKYPAGQVGSAKTGTQFPMVFANMQGMKKGYYQELYFRYYVKFENGFKFMKGGKLPGLMGGGKSWQRSGGSQPNGSNGWTLRMMWRANGKLVVYAYIPKSGNGKWGGEKWGQDIDCNFTLVPGKWHAIEQYVNVGTPRKDNGKLRIWIDGKQKVNINDMRFWNVKNNMGRIGGIYFSTFHGGSGSSWAPTKTSYTQFDGIATSTQRIGTQ
jgi:hypothetical protein